MAVSTSLDMNARGSSSIRRRKPTITYQSPGSGLVDMGLVARNTGLEYKAAAVASVFRHADTASSASAISPATKLLHKPKDIPLPSQETLTRLNPSLYRPLSIPRPPPRLYHTLARFSMVYKRRSTVSLTSQGRTPDSEPERRSSSRARRPAPKVRDTDSAMESLPEPPAKRKRGRRRRTAAQQEADDGAYAATKRARKSKETDIDGDGMASAYSTRARKPRPARAGSSMSDGSESLATPASGESAKT